MIEMSYCYEHGIKHSEWLDWDPVDRAKVVAYRLEEADRCAMCGTAQWEWDENRFAYEPVEKLCQGCYLKEIARQDSHGEMPGTTITLLPTNTQAAARRMLMMKQRWETRDVSDDDGRRG